MITETIIETHEEVTTTTPAQDVADLLRKAAYTVGQPGAWTQHYLGRLKDGTGTYVRAMLRGDEVVARCMLGALYCEFDGYPSADTYLAYQAIATTIGTGLLADWNDAPERTHAEVVDALMKAAELAEGAA